MKNIKNFLIPFTLTAGALLISFNTYGDSNIYHLSTQAPEYTHEKPDFAAMPVKEKKETFIKLALIGINSANNEICAERKEVKDIQKSLDKNKKINNKQEKRLNTFAEYYKVDYQNLSSEQVIQKLLIRIDTAPQSFVLAQAILESGWGTSRFATEYNNYFGLHCFEDGCGAKAEKADVYMEIFRTPGDSILGYYYRLNTGGAFEDFRQVRAKTNGKSNQVDDLLNTLSNYSELSGDEYKQRLLSVIDYNNLRQYDTPTCGNTH
ncbi:glucosaminidase domain-containing protein [Francisella frigiditurris]|uniref:Mannosyl-glycoendo-beta-N-acetylglucosaminidase family protein n=1 Tax=Francisella frigiditurris TaxID=1542390 RepID=A0A1J0KSC9_9GAMM|nr:glucosaminidase domain-containing protein [Francisella frigiditurris]APC96558.1 mannosyl-glycoendo-beta-N-acetylglucosaminidase family protein [Francisella frigiditurris]